MPQPSLSDLPAILTAAGRINTDHVLAVRRAVFGGDCSVSSRRIVDGWRSRAEAICRIEDPGAHSRAISQRLSRLS